MTGRFRSLLAILAATPVIASAQQVPPGVDTVGVRPVNLVGLGPNGATLRCRDGSYPAPFATDAACAAKGGVLVRFRVRGSPPAPATRPKAAPPAALTAPSASAQASAAAAGRSDAVLPPPHAKPDGATLLCRDGSYVVADTSASRCASKGGVKIRFLIRPRPRPR